MMILAPFVVIIGDGLVLQNTHLFACGSYLGFMDVLEILYTVSLLHL